MRNLVGQARLRELQSTALAELISANNVRACNEGKHQFVVLPEGKSALGLKGYESAARKLVGNKKLTELQAMNLQLNLQLIELEQIRNQKGPVSDDDHDDDVFAD